MLQSCGRQEHRSSGEDDNDALYSLYAMYQVIPILLLCVCTLGASLHLHTLLCSCCVVSTSGYVMKFSGISGLPLFE